MTTPETLAMSNTRQDATDKAGTSVGKNAGNRNALRHGLFGAKLPAGCRYISNAVDAFRKQLETEVLVDRGAIGVQDEAYVQSATRHETRAKLVQRYLRQAGDGKVTTTTRATRDGNGASRTTSEGLSVLERVQLLRELSAATDSRDKCIERLKLPEAGKPDPWSILDPPAALPHASPTTDLADDGSVTEPAGRDTSDPVVSRGGDPSMSNVELIHADNFLSEAEFLVECVTTVEELRGERVATIHHRQELVTLRQRLKTIDDGLGRAACRVVAIERELERAEKQRLEARARCEQTEPRKADR